MFVTSDNQKVKHTFEPNRDVWLFPEFMHPSDSPKAVSDWTPETYELACVSDRKVYFQCCQNTIIGSGGLIGPGPETLDP